MKSVRRRGDEEEKLEMMMRKRRSADIELREKEDVREICCSLS